MGLLDGGLRTRISANPNIKALMLPGILTRRNRGFVRGRHYDQPEAHNVLGFLDTRRVAVPVGGSNTITGSSQRIAVILGLGPSGDVIPEPMPQDRIEFQGETHRIQTVERDPAGATWTLALTETGAES